MGRFAEIETLVYEITARPDLVVETKQAIKQATSMLHGSGEYTPDIVTVQANTVKDDTLDVYQVLINEAPFVRFRKAIQVLDSVTRLEFEEVDVTTLFDSSGFSINNVYYRAGTALNIRSAGVSSVLVSYMQRPNTTEGNYSSWIAEEYEYAIVAAAASYIFSTIGNKDAAARQQQTVVLGVREIQKDYLRN